jgi:hypothetical protein
MMVLKYLNKNLKMKKELEFQIWQEAVNGSVWHGSRYGIAYALAKRGAKTQIISNAKDEGYEKKLAVYRGNKPRHAQRIIQRDKGEGKEVQDKGAVRHNNNKHDKKADKRAARYL